MGGEPGPGVDKEEGDDSEEGEEGEEGEKEVRGETNVGSLEITWSEDVASMCLFLDQNTALNWEKLIKNMPKIGRPIYVFKLSQITPE